MPENKSPFLPGGDSPVKFFLNEFPERNGSLLLLGNGFPQLVSYFIDAGFSSIIGASNENTEIFEYKANTPKEKQIPSLCVDYASLDYDKESFDHVFCQATLTLAGRNKLIREIRRVLKPGGFLTTSEILCNKKPAPTFLNDIWAESGQDPLYTDEFEAYYTSRSFKIKNSADFTNDLDEFYIKSYKLLESSLKSLPADKRVQFRKDFVQEKHEITSLVKGGALKYMNFKTMILQKP